MTLTLDLPDHLAAPLEPQAIDPSGWILCSQPDALPPTETDPGFLLRARAHTEHHPDSSLAWARLAQAAEAVGHSEEATTAAEHALHIGVSEESLPALYAAIVVLSARKPQSLHAFLESAEAEKLPTTIIARAAAEAGEHEFALKLIGDAEAPSALSFRAWLHLERREFDRAIASIRKAQRQGVVGPAQLVNLGYAHAALGNLEKAIRFTKEAAVLAPKDRLIGFNLAGFLRAAGNHDEALARLNALRRGEQADIELALAIADVLTETGQRDEAYRVLQRVRTSQQWAVAEKTRRCELEANLAVLRWITDREKADAATKALVRALKACDYQSLSIAYLLMPLVRRREQASELARLLAELHSRHPAEELLGLSMHLAVLRREAREAVAHAQGWASHDILNPHAAALAVYLTSDLAGDIDTAVKLGTTAIRRSPASLMLVNNTAYVLALAGRTHEAKALLSRLGGRANEHVFPTATRALAELLGGNLSVGMAGYRRAWELAESQGDRALAYLVNLNLALAINRLPAAASRPDPRDLLSEEIPREWAERIDFWIASQRVEREMGIPLKIAN